MVDGKRPARKKRKKKRSDSGTSGARDAATAQPERAPVKLQGHELARGWPLSSVIFALVAGLALGYAIGREVSLRSDAQAPVVEAGTPTKQAQPAGDRGAIGKAQKGNRTQPTGPAYVEIAAHNPRRGPKHAKVTLVEFTDFQ